MKILKLHGTIEEKINTMLENAGWYAGRRVNIDRAPDFEFNLFPYPESYATEVVCIKNGAY